MADTIPINTVEVEYYETFGSRRVIRIELTTKAMQPSRTLHVRVNGDELLADYEAETIARDILETIKQLRHLEYPDA